MKLCEVCKHSQDDKPAHEVNVWEVVRRAQFTVPMVGATDMDLCRRHWTAYGKLKAREKQPKCFVSDPTNPQVLHPGRYQ